MAFNYDRHSSRLQSDDTAHLKRFSVHIGVLGDLDKALEEVPAEIFGSSDLQEDVDEDSKAGIIDILEKTFD